MLALLKSRKIFIGANNGSGQVCRGKTTYEDTAVVAGFPGAHVCSYLQKEADTRIKLTSKLTEPFLFVSKASNRKCAYILESAKVEAHSYPTNP